ncbi:UDP-N-acetylmuramate--L-alanine ligase [Paenibacillus sp. J31TS4]|uniref:UDP-N-acetylmuramate--L-alanine ligase n=1 Tax=Paenibacillus sp. J31TS4 TaxID=2807195 RepID=UPI001B18D6E8|nr:UDP-N-acetylmuramate--L-alanine ligase [Paenibacillus sp. J31TS4]GIP37275.1 UDP-N-acetylmuramate--L-alanine ligase [Paenibacillus sp. J31TS4]
MGRYHFIGIKGSGMSAAAQILHDLGHSVQGEDIEETLFTETPLRSRGIPIYRFTEAPLAEGDDITVIASNAYRDDHPAVARVSEAGIPVIRYHHFLGEWMSPYTSIAVTGSHGKTTTTGMLSHALSGVEPVCSLIGDGTGTGTPGSRLFVFESCEYRNHFLAYSPELAVITNIDFDHPDFFSDIEHVRQSFEKMAERVKRKLIVCGDDPQVSLLRTAKPLLRYGFGETNELRALDLAYESGMAVFDVEHKGRPLGRFRIPSFGRHNVLNALAVIGVALELDLPLENIRRQLATFLGVKRRFSETEWKRNVLIDDYAHHPSEIKATLEAARSKYPNRRIIGVFQPHTYSRVEKLLEEFALSLREADDVFLCDIFGSAREQAGSVTIEDLRDRIPNSRLLDEDTVSLLSGYEESVLIFMGAGDIQKYQRVLQTL